MIKHKKISHHSNDEFDNIDKFIFKLAKKTYIIPHHTKQNIRNTINYIFYNKK